MYLEFYGLEAQPFHINPDPDFIYLSDSHKEALASIIYGVEQRKGFIVITGEVGLGKTTILRAYLKQCDHDHLETVFIFNTKISFKELIISIYEDLGIAVNTDDQFQLILEFQRYLVKNYQKGSHLVLIIDEAQNMPLETLEELRMLSNLETSKDKLLQIILIGQPELEDLLELQELRQLKQRIAVRAILSPLKRNESLEYIHHRLAKAGGDAKTIFTKGALKRIIDHSEGIPRKINIVCDNALVTGLGYQQKPVTVKIVDEVIGDLEGRRRPDNSPPAETPPQDFRLQNSRSDDPALDDSIAKSSSRSGRSKWLVLAGAFALLILFSGAIYGHFDKNFVLVHKNIIEPIANFAHRFEFPMKKSTAFPGPTKENHKDSGNSSRLMQDDLKTKNPDEKRTSLKTGNDITVKIPKVENFETDMKNSAQKAPVIIETPDAEKTAESEKTDPREKSSPKKTNSSIKESNIVPMNSKKVKNLEPKRAPATEEKKEVKSATLEGRDAQLNHVTAKTKDLPEISIPENNKNIPKTDLQSGKGDDPTPAAETPDPNDVIDWLLKKHADEKEPR